MYVSSLTLPYFTQHTVFEIYPYCGCGKQDSKMAPKILTFWGTHTFSVIHTNTNPDAIRKEFFQM